MRLFPKKKDWRMSASLSAIAVILFFSVLLVSPSVKGELISSTFYESNWELDINETSCIMKNNILYPQDGYVDYLSLDKLVIYYDFDIDANNTLSGYDGINHGATHKVNEKIFGNGSYYFDGTNDYIDTNFTYEKSGVNNGFTVSLWVKSNLSVSYPVAYFGNSKTNNNDFLIYSVYPGDGALPTLVKVSIRGNGGSPSLNIEGVSDILDEEWHNIVVIYNNSATHLYLYVDGVLENNGSIDLNDDFDQSTPFYTYTIGARNDKGTKDRFYKGWIDEVIVTNASSSLEDVLLLNSSFTGEEKKSCFYNSSKFEIDWNRAIINYAKNDEQINFTLTCNDTINTYEINDSTGNFDLDCSQDFIMVNSSYYLQLSKDAIFYNFLMQSSGVSNINITFKDSKTKEVIDFQNVSLNIIGDYLSRSYINDSGKIFISALDNGYYTFRYSSIIDGNTTYPEKFYYYDLTTNTSIVLYLTNATIANNVTVTVYDQNGDDLEKAFVKAYRYDISSNSYLLDESSLTNFEGQAFFDLELYTEYYKFVVEYPVGTIKKETSPTYLTTTDLVIRISTRTDFLYDYDFVLGTVTQLTFNNDTDTFRFFYGNNDNITKGCLRVYTFDNSQGTQNYNFTCSNSNTAIIYAGVAPTNGTLYIAKAVLFIGNKEFMVAELWQEYRELSPFGKAGVFFAFLILLVGALMGARNIVLGGLLFTSLLVLVKIIGFITWSWGIIISIWILGLLLIFLIGKKMEGLT